MTAKISQINISFACSLLVNFTMYESVETWKGYIYAVLMFLTAIGNSLLIHTMFKLSFDIGGQANAAITSKVYKKVRMTEIRSRVSCRC